MDFGYLTLQLKEQSLLIQSLTMGIPAEQARWRPAEGAWSMLEVINHVYDEEVEDFRMHLGQVLAQDGQAWHKIAPMGWVSERAYNQRDWQLSIENFMAERQKSLAWLAVLPQPDWSLVMGTPWGSINAGELFASWVAHDWLHIRQLVELRRALAVESVSPYRVEYAGDW